MAARMPVRQIAQTRFKFSSSSASFVAKEACLRNHACVANHGYLYCSLAGVLGGAGHSGQRSSLGGLQE